MPSKRQQETRRICSRARCLQPVFGNQRGSLNRPDNLQLALEGLQDVCQYRYLRSEFKLTCAIAVEAPDFASSPVYLVDDLDRPQVVDPRV